MLCAMADMWQAKYTRLSTFQKKSDPQQLLWEAHHTHKHLLNPWQDSCYSRVITRATLLSLGNRKSFQIYSLLHTWLWGWQGVNVLSGTLDGFYSIYTVLLYSFLLPSVCFYHLSIYAHSFSFDYIFKNIYLYLAYNLCLHFRHILFFYKQAGATVDCWHNNTPVCLCCTLNL